MMLGYRHRTQTNTILVVDPTTYNFSTTLPLQTMADTTTTTHNLYRR